MRSGFGAEAEPEGDAGALWEAVRGLVAGSASQSGAVELFELKSVRGRAAEIVVRDPSKAGIAKSWVQLVQSLLSKAAGAAMQVTLAEAGGSGVASPNGAHGAVGAGPAASGHGGGVRTLRMVDPALLPPELKSAGASALEIDAVSRAAALEQPLVKKAIDLFNARLIGVEDDAEATDARDRRPGTG